jgi:hypothetical protein
MKLLRSKQLYIHLRTDVHLTCILADDEIEITIYLFDLQFRAKFKQYKKPAYSVTVIIATCNIPQQKIPSAYFVVPPLLHVDSLTSENITFIIYCFLLRIILAVGCCALQTASFTLTAKEFPDSVATVFVSISLFITLGKVTAVNR